MGVYNLWTLLSPAARKIRIESLCEKILAIDVSIWLIQMIYGYITLTKNEYNHMHLIGIFRRIVKLLMNGIKPVFVFDGKAPELKKETLRKRYEQREKKKKNLKKIAEKYLSSILEQKILEHAKPKLNNPNNINNQAYLSGDEENLVISDAEDKQHEINEFEKIVEENEDLLEENGVDLEEFYVMDVEDQLEKLKKLREERHQKRMQKFENIPLEALSTQLIKEHVNYYKKKAKKEKLKESERAQFVTKEQEALAEKQKFKDILTNQYIKSFFNDPKKKMLGGVHASDTNRGYIYISKGNNALKQGLKLEKKKFTKWEKLRNFNMRMQQLSTNTTSNNANYGLMDLLEENPLMAFKRESDKIEIKNEKNIGDVKELTWGNKEKEIIKPRKNADDDDDDDDLDDIYKVLGDTEDKDRNTQQKLVEKESKRDEIKQKNDLNTGIIDQEQSQKHDDIKESNIKKYELDFKSEHKTKNEGDNPVQSKEILNEEDENLKYFEDSETWEKSSAEGIKKDLPTENLNLKTATDNISLSINKANFQKKNEVLIKSQDLERKIEENSNKQQEWEDLFSPSISKQSSGIENVTSQSQPIPKNLDIEKKESEIIDQEILRAQLESKLDVFRVDNVSVIRDKSIPSNEKSKSLLSNEKPKINSQFIGNIDSSQKLKNTVGTSALANQPEELDEEEILKKMEETEELNNLDKWTLMEEYNKLVNMQGLEGGSIQDKLEEIKYLLTLFGIPWVESPSEAEAQCAFLEMMGLVDGIVSDDNDTFLFGGRNVYKNIFDKSDNVHYFSMKNIENDLGLTREKLILMALFLGSDYTLGIKGVGIVNAMEVVTSFDSIEGLERFKEWAQAPDILLDDIEQHYQNIPENELAYKIKHRNYKKHWELTDNFPDSRVINAYHSPLVDESDEKFSWGKPDFNKLEELCLTRFKWDQNKIDEMLIPLKKVMNLTKAQRKLTDFFLKEEKIAIINSKRINQAVHVLSNPGDNIDIMKNDPNIEKSLKELKRVSEIKKRKIEEPMDKYDEFKFKPKKSKK